MKMSWIAISIVLEPIQALQYFLQAPRFFEHGRSLQEPHQILLVFYWSQWVSHEKSYSLCNWNQTHIFLSRAILSHSLLSFFLSKAKPIWYSEAVRTKGERQNTGVLFLLQLQAYLVAKKKVLLKKKNQLYNAFEWEEENSKRKKKRKRKSMLLMS